MAGAPAGPALDPERPADRLDAVRETDESRPVRRARRAQPPAGSARPPGASPPRPGCSPETLGSNLRATAVARTPELDRRLAVLAEDNERCWSGRLNPRARSASGLPRASARIRVRTPSSSGRSSRSCRDRAAGPGARPRARALLDDRESLSKGRGAPVNLSSCSPCLEFSDVCRCRDGGRLQRVSVHTDRNLPMTSRRVPDVVSPSDNARAAGRSIA